MLDWRQSGDDPRDATVAPASCVQRKDYFFADFAGAAVDAPSSEPSEDCLYLNVFVPEDGASSSAEIDSYTGVNHRSNGLPVVVWIHGGGFDSGSAHPIGGGNW